MDIAISGSSGLIGTALIAELERRGHRAVRLVRPGGTIGPDDIRWDPTAGTIDAAGLEGIGGVVHLAGVPIGDHRWTAGYKKAIIDSRVAGTGLLARTLAGLKDPPSVFESASAVGYYGDRGDEVITESSGPGAGFPTQVCLVWEGAAVPAAEAGIRPVIIRSGNVISTRGGVLPYMLTPFRLGLGAKFGKGAQWFPWISLEDEVGGIVHVLSHGEIRGPVNVCAPGLIRNADLTKALGLALHRPTPWRAPGFALAIIAGKERAEQVLLGGQRVEPEVLKRTGYTFHDPELAPALRRIVAEH
ncbi:MAG: uncharacterized protein QOI81_1933 [Actinomycetota bacterium]|nr:uncharacterized protein [Actinomycetota bacterium]